MEKLTLDREMIDALRGERGAFTKATVTALGLRWRELQKGWVDRLVGTQMTIEDYERALAGRLQLSKVTLKIRAKRDRKLAAQAAQQAAHPVHADLDQQFMDALDREAASGH
jgi:hypothetical protein